MNEYVLRGIADDVISGKSVIILEQAEILREAWTESVKKRLQGSVRSQWGGVTITRAGGMFAAASLEDAPGIAVDGLDVVVFAGSKGATEKAHIVAVGLAHIHGAELVTT